MAFRITSLALLLFSSLTSLANASAAANCELACQVPLDTISFAGSSATEGYYEALCTNPLRVQSIYLCMQTYCGESEIEDGLAAYQDTCNEEGPIPLPPFSIISNITTQDIQSFPQIGTNYATLETPFNTTVTVSQDLFDIALHTATAQNNARLHKKYYGYAVYGFFAYVFAISAIARLVNFVSNLRGSYVNPAAVPRSSTSRSLKLAVRQYLTTPALFSHHNAQPVGWCTVPQRLQAFTILAFVAMNVVLCSISYDVFAGNLYWPKVSWQVMRYVADRTGVLAIANMPLVFAFAMRNNVLIYLTGWSFQTYNMFHRWVARVATAEAIAHSVCYTLYYLRTHDQAYYEEVWHERYWWMGVIATIAMALLCTLSIYPIRRSFYDFFLANHITLAVLLMIGIFYHLMEQGTSYNHFIWPCIAVWSFDRFMRIVRVVYLNLFPVTATASYSTEAGLIRLNVPVRSGFRPQPGTYYYLYGLGQLKFWESHPFTLSTWEAKTFNTGQLTFLVRPQDGFTRRLKEEIVRDQYLNSEIKSDYYEKQVRLAVEGPYGEGKTLTGYNSVLLIVGGSGITVALSHLQALYEAIHNNKHQILPLRQVHLVWAVQDEGMYYDVYRNELAPWLSSSALTKNVEFRIDVHCTRIGATLGVQEKGLASYNSSASTSVTQLESFPIPAPPNAPYMSESMASSSTTLNEQPITVMNPNDCLSPKSIAPATQMLSNITSTSYKPNINLVNSRPIIHDLVLSEAETWCVRGERLAVVVCGPARMADDTRAAVVSAYALGHDGVDLHNETFGW